jgi:TonB family protein
MKPAILLFCCCFFAFGQNTSPTSETKTQTPANSSDQKPKDNDYGLGIGAHGRQLGALGILSDTQGVDFGPYLKDVEGQVKENWYHLIPESASMKKGKLAIEFAITKDGRVADMRLVASSGDAGLDRPAWGGITASNPFPPLPGEFTGRYLALRFRFYYNPDKSDLDDSANKTSTEAAHANGTVPASDLVNQLDGTWEGDLMFLQGATLSQKEPVTVRYRLTVQGPIVHVYVVRPQDVKEIKPGKFHIDLFMTNAIIYATESGKDHEGTWVETWVFTLTQFDRDTLLTNFSRVVNNLDLPLTSDHSKFAKEAAGKLSRTAFGQDTSTAPEAKPQTPASSADQKLQLTETSPNNKFSKYAAGMSADSAMQLWAQAAAARHLAHGRQLGALDILSDTQGVDFGPYLQRVLQDVKENWSHLIPDSAGTKEGKLAIAFAITKDGKLVNMRPVASSGDVPLDISAWVAITTSRPFAALPGEFTGPYLALRFRFYYNPDESDLDGSVDKTPPEPAHTNETSAHSKSGVTVIISSLGDIYVPAGEWKVVTATVTGTKEQTVEWVTGSGCFPHCGHMTGDLYFAPTVRPSPPVVTLTATSKADPTAKATVNVHIVEPSSNSTVR